jgi:hypothetical protein
LSQEWWFTTVIPVLGRLSLEDLEFKISLGDIVRSYHQKERKKKKEITVDSHLNTATINLLNYSFILPRAYFDWLI